MGTVGREHGLRWGARNFAWLVVYLVMGSLASAVAFAMLPGSTPFPYSMAEVPIVAFGLAIGGFVLCLPGTLVWLFLVSLFPARWSPRSRRLAALLATPVIAIPVDFIFFGWLGFVVGGVFFGILFPLGAGIVIDLNRRAVPDRRPPPTFAHPRGGGELPCASWLRGPLGIG
jgi:hypothetical protein